MVEQGFDAAGNPRRSSYDKSALLSAGNDELFGPGNAQLPQSVGILLLDKIESISTEGGVHGKGVVVGLLSARSAAKFFEGHFKNDPVMPGCFQTDGMWQLAGFFLAWYGLSGRGRATGADGLKFVKEILPGFDIRFTVHIKKIAARAKAVKASGVVEFFDGETWVVAATVEEIGAFLKSTA